MPTMALNAVIKVRTSKQGGSYFHVSYKQYWHAN